MATARQAYENNMAIRQNILAQAVPVIQNVRSGSLTYTYGQPTTWTVLASNVGLIRRFYLVLSGTVNAASTYTATPTAFGLANLLSNVTFIDQNNRQRINTTGAHLHFEATVKRKRIFGAAQVASTGTSDPTGFGINFPVMKTTGVVTGTTSKNFTWIWEIPVVVDNRDLTGAVYANQTTSNNQLQFTLNPNAFVYSADGYNAAYKMNAALATSLPTLTNLTWTLYQDFLDQLPVDPTGFAQLPPLDIAYAQCLQYINPGPQVAAQDNLYALPPFNLYQGIMAFWDNYTYNTTIGGDVDTIKVQISNTYILKQYDPLMLAVRTRNHVGADLPGFISSSDSGAVYYLDFHDKPLSVNQLSSTNIVFHPNTVNSGASLMYGQKYLWFANQALG